MRTVIISGPNGFRLEIGSHLDLICKIIEIGDYFSDLIYKAKMNGSQLLDLLKEFNLYEKYKDLIDENLMYTITAYDW